MIQNGNDFLLLVFLEILWLFINSFTKRLNSKKSKSGRVADSRSCTCIRMALKNRWRNVWCTWSARNTKTTTECQPKRHASRWRWRRCDAVPWYVSNVCTWTDNTVHRSSCCPAKRFSEYWKYREDVEPMNRAVERNQWPADWDGSPPSLIPAIP